MHESHAATEEPDRPEAPPYTPAVLIEAGDVVDLTNGTTSNDTADRKAYYW